jgi:glycosyltransferase involved in cell wall biosynthesis
VYSAVVRLANLAQRSLRLALLVALRGIGAGRTATERALRGSRTGADRLIVLDPGLVAVGGHRFEFARLLHSEFDGARKVTCYAHRRASPAVVAALNPRLIFRSDPYPAGTGVSFAELYRTTTRALARDLNEIDSDDLRANTIAVEHTASVLRLGGLAEWYGSLAIRRRPKLFVQFQVPLEATVQPRSEWPAGIRLARDAAAALTSAGTVRFAANSDLLASRLSEQLDRPCAVMPVPVRWPRHAIGPPDPGIVFGFFGGLRAEKGADILAAAVRTFAESYPDARFIIQAPPEESDAEIVATLSRLPRVELIPKSFTRKDAYFRSLGRAGWILLPYDPERYAIRTSGIFLEALGLGIPVVVTAGTWMARELQSSGARGVVMPAYTAPALHDCLEQARARMLAGRDEARIGDRPLIAEHSAATFCASIVRLMESSSCRT